MRLPPRPRSTPISRGSVSPPSAASRTTLFLAALLVAWGAGCSDDVAVLPGANHPPTPPAAPGPAELAHRGTSTLDLLLAIDNSRSMAEKQALLADAAVDIISSLSNPLCIDSDGVPSQVQPSSAFGVCPPGTARQYSPFFDVHIGLVSSSLGGHGADACGAVAGAVGNDDRGHLLARSDALGGPDVPTYQDRGFLSWDPKAELAPPGEPDLSNLVANLRTMVGGVGQSGCGFESQLESVYRFLADPEPYATIAVGVDGKVETHGVDETLLQQRKDFLRPSSLLAVVLLSDENDCSIKESGQFYLAAQLATSSGPYHLPKARAACATDPLSACCRSCGQPAGNDESGSPCPEDPSCALHDDLSDAPNLRCFDQKRRFGIDFLYPTARYVDALSQPTIQNRSGQLVPNPVFSDLAPEDGDSEIRDAGRVFLLGLVGVPWQDLARNPHDASQGYRRFDELSQPDAQGVTGWDIVLGAPSEGIPPLDPLMAESIEPRSGVNPATGVPLAPPDAPNGAHPVNGHERSIPLRDDLQYTCIFDLPAPRDCGPSSTEVACDCAEPENDSPLCEPNPSDLDADGAPRRTLQVRAKAYPGLRELEVLRGLGDQGIPGSVCPNPAASWQYGGYVGSGHQLVSTLQRVALYTGPPCLAAPLAPDGAGQVACVVVEAQRSATCDCSGPGREPVSPEHAAVRDAIAEGPGAVDNGWNCFCEVTQLAGPELDACRLDVSYVPVVDGESVDGWCYIDATTSPPTGDPTLVEDCPADQARTLRLVGGGMPSPGATELYVCEQAP